LRVRKLARANDDVIALLKDTVLGSEGGMRYSMQNTPERIATYGDGLSFLALYKMNSLKGVIGLCRRVIRNRGTQSDATYLSYLAVQSAFQTERAPGRRGERALRCRRQLQGKDYFTDPRTGTDPDRPHVMYAYVESRNERSRNMINQSGYEYIRSFLTVAFSRFNPKPNPDVTRLKPEEEPAMAVLLDEQYRDYCFYTNEFSFHDHKYYVLRAEVR
jgi:hypothetical protein